MHTINDRTELQARVTVVGRIATRLRNHRRLLAVFLSVAAFLGGNTAAFADTTDPTAPLFSGATTSLTTVLIPAVVGIVLIVALFWLGVKYFQKAIKK